MSHRELVTKRGILRREVDRGERRGRRLPDVRARPSSEFREGLAAPCLQLSEMTTKATFEAVVDEHWSSVHRFALHLSGAAHDADDIAQQTFFQAYRAWPGFRGDAHVRTWLFRIAIRVAGRVLRQRERAPGPLGDVDAAARDPSPPSVLAADEEATRVRAALARLRPIHRLVLTLFLVEDVAHREIAELLECAEGTVWSRLHSAKAALRTELSRTPEDIQRV